MLIDFKTEIKNDINELKEILLSKTKTSRKEQKESGSQSDKENEIDMVETSENQSQTVNRVTNSLLCNLFPTETDLATNPTKGMSHFKYVILHIYQYHTCFTKVLHHFYKIFFHFVTSSVKFHSVFKTLLSVNLYANLV